MIRIRHRKVLDVTQYHSMVAVGYFTVIIPLGKVAAVFGWRQPAMLAALGLAALVGWLGQSIIGYLYKIVPFLIWHASYGPLVGRKRVPLMRELVHERWAWPTGCATSCRFQAKWLLTVLQGMCVAWMKRPIYAYCKQGITS
jgi:hypothetical protein